MSTSVYNVLFTCALVNSAQINHERISIIIPVFNESGNIDNLIEYLLPLKEQCEIFFVDGGSSDDTAKRIEEKGLKVYLAPKKGRANQMNYGAHLSGGDILWFLHADSIPPKGALLYIREILNSGYKIGCFPLRFDSKCPLMFLNAHFSNLRVKMRNITFGDQGIFIQRNLFESLNGYAVIPLMEDYQLSIDIKKAGLHIGMAGGKITTSPRRYLAQGKIKTIFKMWRLQRMFRRGDDIEEIAKAYGH